MPNPTDPFEMDEGVENIPVVKAPVQAVKNAGVQVAKQTAQQVKQTTQAFINQLYGVTDATSDTTTDAAANQTGQTQPQKQVTQSQSANPHPQQPTQSVSSDQAKLEQTRRALQQTHTSEYFNPVIGDLETQIKREEQKRAQMKQQEEQQEEQEKQQMAELEEQKKKEEPPIAVQMARSKSERRPGAG